jgi:hypothetical protein
MENIVHKGRPLKSPVDSVVFASISLKSTFEKRDSLPADRESGIVELWLSLTIDTEVVGMVFAQVGCWGEFDGGWVFSVLSDVAYIH